MRRAPALLTALLLVSSLFAVPAAVAADSTQETVTLTVSVVNQQGQPVDDATLDASWDGGTATETTASNGKAFVDVPRGADVTINVTHPDFVRNFPRVVENAEERDVEVTVSRKGRATIRTRDTNGNPVSARVTIENENGREVVRGRSNDEGVFQSGVLERGDYDLLVFRSGYFRNRTDLSVTGDVSETVVVEQGSVVVEFEVRDDHFSPPRPVPNATVSVADIGTVQTLSNGEATIKVPVNSRVGVRVSKPAYDESEFQINVFESQTTVETTIQRTPAITVDPANDRVVVGETTRVEVRNEYDTPVANATVTLDGDTVGRTDEQGALTVRIESPGNHTLRASAGSLDSDGVVVQGVAPAGTETATPPPTDTPTPTEPPATGTSPAAVSLPGFTPVTAVLAVALLTGLALLGSRRG